MTSWQAYRINKAKTREIQEDREIDDNYTATYYPDVKVDDPVNFVVAQNLGPNDCTIVYEGFYKKSDTFCPLEINL